MNLEKRSSSVTELFSSLSKYGYSPYIGEKIAPKDAEHQDSKAEKFEMNEAKKSLLKAIYLDDKAQLLTHTKRLFQIGLEPLDRRVVSKILHLSCASDSVECAAALMRGEFGTVPLVNEMDESGWSALHSAAESHSKRCVELLLKKRIRTDLKTKDGRSLLALELSLCSSRMEVTWNPNECSIEDLVILLTEKDLTTVRLLSERTKEIVGVAYANAVNGRIVPLAALLIVAPEKVNETVLELRDAESGSKEKTTIYERVIREALSLGRETMGSRAAKRTCTPSEAEKALRRKLMLCEIELLQLFGAVASNGCTEKRGTSPLIRACQAGDVAVIELLLKTNIAVNDIDAEGNSALHWSLKASPEQMKIVWLLLDQGAEVSQKNKLGLTTLHVAAANGNSQAIQVFMLEDPDSINCRTEMKETPLFFAVKNDHIDCTEILLRWGANSEVLNLRQRPVDLAKSQDMRFLLNSTNISQSDEIISETFDALLDLTDEKPTTTDQSICSSAKAEICKYFGSPRGCIRGIKCLYAHGEMELRQMKQGTHLSHNPTSKKLRRKIFVGGLPSMLDSDSLGKFFEEQFGAVEEGIVLGIQAGSEIKSRGFGFVTFKQEKSVAAAVETRHVIIMGKRVEIKSVLPKCLLLNEFQKLSTDLTQQNQEQSRLYLPQAERPIDKITEEPELEQMSWANRIRLDQQKTHSNELQGSISPGSVDQTMPAWLSLFKRWLPRFLEDRTTRLKGEYPYPSSSLKRDFRALFNLELDHASLGFFKLIDFLKSLHGLCRVKVVPIGKDRPASHFVILPNLPTASCASSINESADSDSSNSKCLRNLLSGSCEKNSSIGCSTGAANPALGYPKVTSSQNDALPAAHPGFLQFLKPDPLFHGRPWLRNENNAGAGGTRDEGHQRRHLVLEALARKRKNTSVFFLADLDFFKDYKSSLDQGHCFGCNQRPMLWANFPCEHLLWCSECKENAISAAGASEHKCVLCNLKVEKIGLLPWHMNVSMPTGEDIFNAEEFPPFDPTNLRSPSTKKKPPMTGG